MKFILFHPPRKGLRVYYHAQEGGAPYPGVYSVADTEDYDMVGFVTIEDSRGHCYGVSAEHLEILEDHEAFKDLALSVSADGVLFLPSEERLRSFGFTDRREGYWYYSAAVGSHESFNLTVPKEPIGEVLGEPVYSYTEGVIDEFFGQHAYFGGMKDEFRYPLVEKVSAVLQGLLGLGILVRVRPEEYNWEGWPQRRPLTGGHSDRDTIKGLQGGSTDRGAEES